LFSVSSLYNVAVFGWKKHFFFFSNLNIFSIAGCTGGVGRGNAIGNGIYSGGGYGGRGGEGCFNNNCVPGGISYGEADLPCELGSGSGNDSLASFSSGGGIIGEFILHVLCGMFFSILRPYSR